MSKPRPFRFGVSVHGSKSRAEWIGIARQAEALGYSTLLIPDHLGDQLSPIPALVAAADATSTLRVGSLVFDNDFRHPVMLAKEAATLDVLSGGRLELGLGAGWMKPEYEQAGIPFERASVRIGRMEEAIRIVKGLFADGPVDFAGQYYTVTGFEGFPKPVQRPHPPLHIESRRQGGRDKLRRLLAILRGEHLGNQDAQFEISKALPRCLTHPGNFLLKGFGSGIHQILPPAIGASFGDKPDNVSLSGCD